MSSEQGDVIQNVRSGAISYYPRLIQYYSPLTQSTYQFQVVGGDDLGHRPKPKLAQ